MTDTGIAHDFIDIALMEIEEDNMESAEEFVDDAADILSDEPELSDIYSELEKALEAFEGGDDEVAYEKTHNAWKMMAEL